MNDSKGQQCRWAWRLREAKICSQSSHTALAQQRDFIYVCPELVCLALIPVLASFVGVAIHIVMVDTGSQFLLDNLASLSLVLNL